MTRAQFSLMVVGDEVRHVRSGQIYRMTTKIPVPSFCKVSRKGTLKGVSLKFLPEHIEVTS